MNTEIFRPVHPASLAGPALRFFELFEPGALLELYLDWKIGLDELGENMSNLAEAVKPLRDLCVALKISQKTVSLGDLSDEEFARTVWFLGEFPKGTPDWTDRE